MARDNRWSGVALILIGAAFLLNTLDIVDFSDLIRFWPLILIAVGIRIVIQSRSSGSGQAPAPPSPS